MAAREEGGEPGRAGCVLNTYNGGGREKKGVNACGEGCRVQVEEGVAWVYTPM